MKKFLFFIGMVAMLSIFNSCSVGYVSDEPVYQTYERPQRPSNEYIWIEGGWVWNAHTRSYTQVNGTWVRQDQSRKHKQGHWEKSRHGSRWVKNR